MTLKPFQFSKRFVADRCNFCGRCLSECPVLQWPLERARKEIHALIEDRDSEALARCTGCMACNSICPQDANPHTLIVNRWEERYRKEGIPYAAGLVLPYQEPKVYTVAAAKLPEDEQALVRQWKRNLLKPQCDTMIYAGCNVLLMPFLMDSALFDDVPIFGSLDLCCGEPFYRMGCWDAARAAAKHVQEEFDRMRLKKVIVPCLAGYHLFKYVHPEVLDVHIKAEVVSMEDWLLERIANGQLRLKPLNQSAVLHDNCWPKASGENLFAKVRDLLRLAGVTVIEPEHTRERALCCGMCAGAARLRLRDIVATARRRLKEFDRAGADMAIDYCGGCDWLFSLVDQMSLSSFKTPRYHILEVIQRAAGETPGHRTAQRTRGILASMTPRLMVRYLRGGRFWIESVAGKPVEPMK
jgi:Fe-S oxidoreductase